MTPEEYQRIKEAEKEHLKAVKKLKAQLRQVEKKGKAGTKKTSLEQAMDEIENAPGGEILDTHEEMIDRLAMDAIHQEARLELALSSQKDLEPAEPTETAAEPEANVQSDEELKQLRAKELVRKMKIQMGLDQLKRKQEPAQDVTKEGGQGSSTVSTPESASTERTNEDKTKLPDKTIGRIPKK